MLSCMKDKVVRWISNIRRRTYLTTHVFLTVKHLLFVHPITNLHSFSRCFKRELYRSVPFFLLISQFTFMIVSKYFFCKIHFFLKFSLKKIYFKYLHQQHLHGDRLCPRKNGLHHIVRGRQDRLRAQLLPHLRNHSLLGRWSSYRHHQSPGNW